MQALGDELAVLRPREIIVPASDVGAASTVPPAIAASGLPTTAVDAWTFDVESARRTLLLDAYGAGHSRATSGDFSN